MDEKTMVNDILDNVKSSLKTYQGVITEAENMQLRQTLQQIRNGDESFQYELFKVAQTKGYYQPAQKATVTEIQTVKRDYIIGKAWFRFSGLGSFGTIK